MLLSSSNHFHVAHQSWKKANSIQPGQTIWLTGDELDIATVVAIARKQCLPKLSDNHGLKERINNSVKVLDDYLSHGHEVYGVTTGFGGSADSRTRERNKLQVALLQLTQSGILLPSDRSDTAAPLDYFTEGNSMPPSWAKATMIVRCNATARGHSAVTLKVLETILELLRLGLTPIIPLRGTVSASGDLMPLAYIAGVLEGNSDVFVRKPDGSVITADKLLAEKGISSITFGPKEALGLVNGTAASAALGALVIYDAHQLAVLSQAFTAMAVEGLLGNSESFHPFIQQVRPHNGQIETGQNILAFLQGSLFAQGIKTEKLRNRSGLAQDRYALRSTPQWIGPQLEDLCLAHQQISVELNSSADNPLVDVEKKDVLYGANFQAASITSAMEKTRLALQMLGKLYFAQATELIDHTLNNGLPANLCADDPSVSFTMKGVEINMAAYMSELAYLANPISTHVQTAEMHNQSINSLAFISARMTMKAVELMSMMCASCLFVGCQALDLRALQFNFFLAIEPVVKETTQSALWPFITPKEITALNSALVGQIADTWKESSRLDIVDRFNCISKATVSTLLSALEGHPSRSEVFKRVDLVDAWRDTLKQRLSDTYDECFKRFCSEPSTVNYIGVASRALYTVVRRDLAVPFLQGVVEHPTFGKEPETPNRSRKSVGGWISVIYEAILDGKLNETIYEMMDGDATNGATNGTPNGEKADGPKTNGHK